MAIWLIPTIGLLVNSFRPAADVADSGWWTGLLSPTNLTLDNYRKVLGQSGLIEAFINSLFITIPATIIPIFVAAFAAYAFAWMNFPFRNILFVVVVGLLVVPLQTTLIPILRLFARAWDSRARSWRSGWPIPATACRSRSTCSGTSWARCPRRSSSRPAIDGASPATAFFRLALPMSVPAIAALAIFQFLFVWNDLLVALIYLGASNPENLPLTVVIANLVNSLGGGWHLLGPRRSSRWRCRLLVFFALQRYFVRGITGGAVKG